MEQWYKDGGVMILGYDMFRNLAGGMSKCIDENPNTKELPCKDGDLHPTYSLEALRITLGVRDVIFRRFFEDDPVRNA